MMQKNWHVGLGMVILAATAMAAPAAFDHSLFVVRLGDTGVGVVGSGQQTVHLDEYDTSGASAVFKRSIDLTSTGGSALTLPSVANIDNGRLSLSTNGQYLLLGGYRANAGDPDSSKTLASSVNRVIGRVDAAGNANTSTALTDAYNANTSNPNGINTVLSDDGSRFWLAGSSSAVETSTTNSGGLRYVGAIGATASTNIGRQQITNSDSFRSAKFVGGKLIVTTASQGVFTNRGAYEAKYLNPDGSHPQDYTPVIINTENSLTDAAGNPDDPDGLGKGKWYPKTDAVFLDLDPTVPGVDVAYGTGGKNDYRKWSLVLNALTSVYEWISPIGNVKLLAGGEINALDAEVTSEGVVLYGTLDAGVVRLVDTSGYNGMMNGAFNTSSYYIPAAGGTQFRGLTLVPEPTTLAAIGMLGLASLRRRRGV